MTKRKYDVGWTDANGDHQFQERKAYPAALRLARKVKRRKGVKNVRIATFEMELGMWWQKGSKTV